MNYSIKTACIRGYFRSGLHLIGSMLIIWCAIAGLFCLLFCPCSARAQHAKTFRSNGRDVNIDTLNSRIRQMMEDVAVPGLSLAVIEDNKVVFFNTYGFKDKKGEGLVDKRTVFDACSLSKSFLVFVAHELVDEGKLDLDRPLYQYLEYDKLAYDARYKLITARMVLSHSSGIENWQSQNDPSKLEIINTPGEKFLYSGEGYNYLAKVIEKILGEPYESYIRDRVLKPLGLKSSYVRYRKNGALSFHKETPWDYATGHSLDGLSHIHKNYEVVPASGNHITAADYANLILGLFDTTHLSVNRIRDLETPIVQIDGSDMYYGPGFEVYRSHGDVLIVHGGDNDGFKNQMAYSVAGRRGYVILTNSDRGNFMLKRICELTANLDISPLLHSEYFLTDQYPTYTCDLLRIREQQGIDAMNAEIEKAKTTGKIGPLTLNVAAYYFRWYYGGDEMVTKKLLTENIGLYPDSPLSYMLLGRWFRDFDKPDSAMLNFNMAVQRHIAPGDVADDIRDCMSKLAELAGRANNLIKLRKAGETVVRAEDFNTMSGVRLQKTADEGGGQNVFHIDAGDWMEYRVAIPASGHYSILLRLASLHGGGELELRLGDTILTSIPVAATNGLQNWASQATSVDLPSGEHILRLYARKGGFKINWLKFTPGNDSLTQHL